MRLNTDYPFAQIVVMLAIGGTLVFLLWKAGLMP